MIQQHSVFIAPTNPNQKLWRFLDFTKFVDMLNSEELFFTRPDKFIDPFEGAATALDVEDFTTSLSTHSNPQPGVTDLLAGGKNLVTTCFGVSCWHMNDYESAAMWSSYLKSGEGVAIQTTYDRIVSVMDKVESEAYIGVIRYLDYDKDRVGAYNFMYRIMSKRMSFEHERELRVVVPIHENMKYLGDKDSSHLLKPGEKVQIDLRTLVENVYVSPTSPAWLTNLVRDTCEKFGFSFNVINSRLYDKPLY